jgi:hypothetical protein
MIGIQGVIELEAGDLKVSIPNSSVAPGGIDPEAVGAQPRKTPGGGIATEWLSV